MTRRAKTWLPLTALVLALVALVAGCNDAIDDPKVSPSILTISGVSPSSLCVDGDGEFIDQDGDGTLDGPFFTDVPASFTIKSRIRNDSLDAGLNDVVLTSYEIEFDAPTNPPDISDGGLTVEVPANGSATVSIIVVPATLVGPFFPVGTAGTATVRFRGEDVSGKPARVSGRISFESVNVCK
jgi:hypothetical protein